MRTSKMTHLYSLAYISKNAIDEANQAVEAQIKLILDAAHRNNPALGVTGALLYSGGWFCQVLEGEEDVLDELFETIQMDPRHNQVTVLHFDEIETRGFDEWAMAYAGIQSELPFDIDGVLASKDELKMKETGQSLITTLENIVKGHEATHL